MANRKRPIPKRFDVTDTENALIEKNMAAAGTENFGDFARHMLINGQVVVKDYGAIKEYTKQVSTLGNNVNQIARRVNETHNVYETDVKEVLAVLKEVVQIQKELLKEI